MTQQKRRVTARYQEYPGSTTWTEHEILCPHCGKWCKEYGEVDTQMEDGSWQMLCITCGDTAFPPEEFIPI